MESSPGMVAGSASDHCGSGAPFLKVTSGYGPPGGDCKTGKNVRSKPNEMAAFEKEGYVMFPIDDFYCATTAGQCGATLPLRRYGLNRKILDTSFYVLFRYLLNSGGKSHLLTTNPKEAPGTFVDILCYIWPHPPQPAEWTKMNLHGIKGGDF